MAIYNGTAGNDTITGTADADTLRGNGGADRLDGAGGHDTIFGGAGNDTLIGGDGDDALRGENGDDVMIGGNGSELFRGGAGVDSFDGGAQDPASVTFGAGSFGDRISFFEQAAIAGVIADLRTGIISNDGFGNIETMVGIESLGGDTAFADQFYGNDERNLLIGSFSDTLMGFGGDDAFQLSGAAALIDGGDGVDELNLTALGYQTPDANGDGIAEVRPDATAGWVVDLAAQTMTDGYGDSGTIRGIETVNGTGFDDVLLGSDAAETLRGNDGDDILEGRGGDDVLEGGDGDDLIDGGDGFDEALFNGDSDDFDIVRLANGSIRVSADETGVNILTGVEVITIYDVAEDGEDAGEVELTRLDLTQPSGFVGTLGADFYAGTAGNDVGYASAGNDVLQGGAGDDYLAGGAGDDRFDELTNGRAGGLGNDVLLGGAGNDFILDFFGSNEIEGGDGNDTLGGTGFVLGGSGNDVVLYISSGPSRDRIDGEAGNDIFIVYPAIEADWTADVIVNFEVGNPGELISVAPIVDQLVGYAAGANLYAAGFLRYVQVGGDAVLQVDFDGTAGPGGFTDLLILENIDLGVARPALQARTGLLANISGNRDANSLAGTAGNDFIRAFGGNDFINGNDGNDFIEGGLGNDTINGGAGDDTLNGDAGYELTGGNDLINGGAGNDFINGNRGDDNLRGDAGNDVLLGGDGNDFFRGGAGVDHFDGGGEGPASTTFGPNTLGDRISFFEQGATAGVIADLRTGVIANDGFGNVETMVGIENLGGDTAFADAFYGTDSRNLLLGSLGDTLMGFGGNDGIQVGSAAALVDGGDGVDELILATTGSLRPDANGDGLAELGLEATAGWTVDLAAETMTDGFGATGTVRGIETVFGTGFADVVRGADVAETLRGFGGGDVLEGRGGDDTLVGNEGDDTLAGGADNDFLVGDFGNDALDGGTGSDFATFYFAAATLGSFSTVAGTGADAGKLLVVRTHADTSETVAEITAAGRVLTVTGVGSAAYLGTDTVTNVEKLLFSTVSADPFTQPTTPGFVVVDVATTLGVVADGYVAGATVFVDNNRNGLFDAGEASAVTDANGDFELLTFGDGPIVALGGVNTDTGLANTVALVAPTGSTVINPLTTLVQAVIDSGATAADAETQVKAALGLDAGLDLGSTDLIAAAGAGDTAALAAQQAAAIVVSIIAAASDIDGNAEGALVDQLAATVTAAAAAGATVDLTDSDVIEEVLTAALPDAGDLSGAANTLAAGAAAIAATTSLDALSDAQATAMLTGNDFGNELVSGAQDDTLTGLAGDDRLFGFGGADTLLGGAGQDLLVGGDGFDRLFGGAGDDVFAVGAGPATGGKAGIAFDVIFDFDAAGGDVLALIDAKLLRTQSFGNVNAAEKSLGVELDGLPKHADPKAFVTVVFGDANGDGAADFGVALIGVKSLGAGDVIANQPEPLPAADALI